MCVQAAYVGKDSAPPILLKMLEKTEGWEAGFYTGIATISNGKLYHDKVVGDLSTLRKKTKVEEFPGTVGIAHSRTPGGGEDREWGHPFLDCSGNLALCEQGSPGIFEKEHLPNTSKIAAELIKEGHHFRSATKKLVTASVTFGPSGERIHYTEVICHKIESNLKKSGDMLKAMRGTLNEIKVETAGLAIEVNHPQQVFMATVNKSLAIGWDETGAYVATSALAFPDSVKRSFRLPAGSMAAITPTDLKIVNLPEWRDMIEDPFTPAEVEKAVLGFLKKNPGKSFSEIYGLCVKKFYPEGTLAVCGQAVYEGIEELLKRRKIVYRVERIAGEEGLTAPKMVFEAI